MQSAQIADLRRSWRCPTLVIEGIHPAWSRIEVEWRRVALALIFLVAGCNQAPPPAPDTYWLKSEKTGVRTVLVFVHGVLGDSHGTWTAEGVAGGWPGLVIRDAQMVPADVLAVGYKSQPLSEASNIEEIAVRTLQVVKDEGVFDRYDSIVFVVHSMGGLVTKRMLKTLQSESPPRFAQVKAVLFFSTPAQGSDLAALAEWVSSNPQFRDMKPSDFNSLLQVLDNDWRTLLRKRTVEEPFPRSFCAYETLSTSSLKIVPRSRSEAGCDETPIGFDRDHASIVKPGSEDDEVHKYLRARVAAALDPKLVSQHVTVKIVKPDGSLLQAAGVMRSGDQYSIELSARRPTWFYLFGVDSADRVQRYFPADAAGTQVSTLTSLRVPAKPGLFLKLDGTTGMERLYILALEAPRSDLLVFGTAISDSAMARAHAKADIDKVLYEYRGSYVAPARPDKTGVTPVPMSLRAAAEVLAFEHR